MKEGYEVYVVADAIGGTSVTAHDMGLRRVEQAGGKMISVTQMFCELQRDWGRKETVPGFMTLFFDMGGSAGVAAAED
jgi:nicotinamidase-related amidase